MHKNTRLLVLVLGIVAAMGALSFASVPLYDLFCRVTGYGGTPQTSTSIPNEVLDRSIKIQFNADTAHQLPWQFWPEKRAITLNIGAQGLINFKAANKGAMPVTGTAVYNVTPAKAGQYFHKTQCFCFDEQRLVPGQTVNMPVVFYIDPSIADDENMDDVTTITLSYSFFESDSKALDQALEDFYNAE